MKADRGKGRRTNDHDLSEDIIVVGVVWSRVG